MWRQSLKKVKRLPSCLSRNMKFSHINYLYLCFKSIIIEATLLNLTFPINKCQRHWRIRDKPPLFHILLGDTDSDLLVTALKPGWKVLSVSQLMHTGCHQESNTFHKTIQITFNQSLRECGRQVPAAQSSAGKSPGGNLHHLPLQEHQTTWKDIKSSTYCFSIRFLYLQMSLLWSWVFLVNYF